MLKQLLRLVGLLWLLIFFALLALQWLGEIAKAPLIAFLSEGQRNRNTDLYLADSETALRIRMTNSRSHEEDLNWSPDGRYLSFDLWDEYDGNIWLLDTSNWAVAEMSLGQFTQFSWYSPNELIVASNRRGIMHIFNIETRATRPYSESPQCEKCVFIPIPQAGRITAYDLELSIVDGELYVGIDTTAYISTAFEPNTDLQPWSPDGAHFLFITELQGQPDLYLIAAEGGIARRLTDTPTPEQMPTWSGDGLKISYVSYETGNPEIFIMEAATGYRYNLSRQASRDYNAVWQIVR